MIQKEIGARERKFELGGLQRMMLMHRQLRKPIKKQKQNNKNCNSGGGDQLKETTPYLPNYKHHKYAHSNNY